MKRLVICLAIVATLLACTAHDAFGQAPYQQLAAVLEGSAGDAVTFKPDGSAILTAGDGSARVWDSKSFKPLSAALAHSATALDAFWLGDAGRVCTAGGNEIWVWDVRNSRQLVRIIQESGVNPSAGSPDGSVIVTPHGSVGVAVWDSATGRLLHVLDVPGRLYYARFSRDGKLLTCNLKDLNGDRSRCTALVWDVRTGQQLLTVFSSDSFPAPAADISPDGRLVVVARSGDGIAVRRVATRERITLQSDWRGVERDSLTNLIRFTPNGSHVVWQGDLGFAVFNVANGQRLGEVRTDSWIPAFECDADGTHLILGGKPALSGVWDIQEVERVQKLGGLDTAAVALSPNGTLVATTHRNPVSTRIWKVPPEASDKR